MPEFYVNAARNEDINLTCAWISGTIFDEYNRCNKKYNHCIAKITHKKYSCYVQVRKIDKFYLAYFEKYLSFQTEKNIFEENRILLLFLSDYYRKMLHIEICDNVNSDEEIQKNKKNIFIDLPGNRILYIWFLIMASAQHPELYARLMFFAASLSIIMSIIGIIF